MSLTINQEKKIRAERAGTNRVLRAHDQFAALRAKYESLAHNVSQYRRAQKLNGPGSAELRRDLIIEIDKCLEALGL
jgi:hypothetical protein